MSRRELREMYATPESYQPPNISELSTNSQYPNMNSMQYRYKPIDYTQPELHQFFEFLTVNAFDLVAVAANNYNGRVWCGSVFAYDSFDQFGQTGKEVFSMRVEDSITSMEFYYDDMILLTTAAGDIQLWSTQSPMRNPNGYSLYNIARKCEHAGIVTTMDLLGTKKERAITGSSSDNCIKVWSIGACDMISEHTYRHAHTQAVSGVSVKPNDGYLFGSCSRDGSLLIWDYRNLKPVIKHVNGGPAYTAINWSNQSGTEQIIVGDVNGTLHIHDPRNIEIALQSEKVCDRPIHKLKPHNGLLGVLSQSNQIVVLDATKNYTSAYRNAAAIDFARDIHWTDDRAFNSIGWDQKLSKHTF